MQESSEVDLANKVQEDLLGVPSEYECGPLYFFYMMKRIISSSEDAVVSLIGKVKGMRIMDFEGENVPKATGQIKLAIKRLEILDKVPADIERIVLDVLQTTSVPEFNGFFKQLHTNLKQLPNFVLSTSKVLSMANSQYNELLQIGTWTGTKKQPASFNAGMSTGEGPPNNPHTPDLCNRCGKTHPGPCQILHWRRVTPKDGESHSKRVNDKTYNWCAKCKMWTLTHTAETHVSRADAKNQREASANLAANETTQESTAGSNTTDADSLGSSINYAPYSLAALSTSQNNHFKKQFGFGK